MKVKVSATNKMALKALELDRLGQRAEAVKLFKRALVASPTDWVALFSLGRIQLAEGHPEEALKLLQRLVTVHPDNAPGFDLMGVTLEKLGHYRSATDAYTKSLTLDPKNVDGLIRHGALLSKLNRDNDAIACFERALEIDPAREKVLANLGKLLFFSKRIKDAGLVFERLLAINPNYPFARGLLAFNRAHAADWDGFDAAASFITTQTQSGLSSCMPLAFMALSNSAADNLQCAKTFAANFYPENSTPVWSGQKYRHDKIRVAYISGDFREHPVGHLMAGVIESHDRAKFDVLGISFGVDDASTLRARFEKSFDKFLDVSAMGVDEICHLIESLEVDIAVDLCGFTQDARTELFARRVAPVQVNFLGFPGTMGAGYLDYIVADRHVIPEDAQAYYEEEVVYLPDTYLPTDGTLLVSDVTPTRQEAGLPPSGFVFCSFNHVYKINPKIFDLWMQLLCEVPDSVLWLSDAGPQAMGNLLMEAQRRGVEPHRLVFAKRVPQVADHLARYRLADVFLDTLPYNAHTTAADALFVGLPVITCSGDTFSGRVAGSLLKAIGMPELITRSLDQYKALALEFAANPIKLAETKRKLLANRASYPLFDTQQYCRNLEAAYMRMDECHGVAPVGRKPSLS